jgi:diguanylate cyclase (GGDEF)-like protein
MHQTADEELDAVALDIAARIAEGVAPSSIAVLLDDDARRRALRARLDEEIARARRTGVPLALLMIDLDHFKLFNDSFGHEAGDLLLREFGATFNSQTRGSDIACRLGGEEFLVILMEASTEGARRRAEILQRRAPGLQVVDRGQTLKNVTVSIGVAAFPDHGTTVQDLLSAADKALYRAKTGGRNLVMVADPRREVVV